MSLRVIPVMSRHPGVPAAVGAIPLDFTRLGENLSSRRYNPHPYLGPVLFMRRARDEYNRLPRSAAVRYASRFLSA
jgi:hypothetical protein